MLDGRWELLHWTLHCTVKHHMDIINFACMTWNFVRILASLSALCINFERRKEKFYLRSPFCTPGDQRFCQMWIDSFGAYVFINPQIPSLCSAATTAVQMRHPPATLISCRPLFRHGHFPAQTVETPQTNVIFCPPKTSFSCQTTLDTGVKTHVLLLLI